MAQYLKISASYHTNRLKKNHIIPIKAKKAGDKTQCLFLTKTLRKNRILGNFLNLIKHLFKKLNNNIKKTIADITLYSKRLNGFPKTENRQGCPVTPYYITYC